MDVSWLEIEALVRFADPAPGEWLLPDRTGLAVSWKMLDDAQDDSSALVEVRVRNHTDAPIRAAIRLQTRLADQNPWWMIPGVFYGDNRPWTSPPTFPRFDEDVYAEDELVNPWWEFRADRCATPMVFASTQEESMAWVTRNDSDMGVPGVGFAQRGSMITLWVSFPAQEGPVSFRDGVAEPTLEQWHTFPAGASARTRARLFRLPSGRSQAATLLRRVHEIGAHRYRLAEGPSADACARLLTEGLLRWHVVGGDEPVAVPRILLADTLRRPGGADVLSERRCSAAETLLVGEALLAHAGRLGDTLLATRATSLITAALPRADDSRSGTGGRGRAFSSLVRCVTNPLVPDSFRGMWWGLMREAVNSLIAGQSLDGMLGSVDGTGTRDWSGSGGLAWLPAICALEDGSRYYVSAAERAGWYYARFVHAGELRSTADHRSGPSSVVAAVEAFVGFLALFEATQARMWLELAEKAALWSLTFRRTAPIELNPRTPLGAQGWVARGVDQTSVADRALTARALVGVEPLLRLADALGDPWFAERAHDGFRAWRPLISVHPGELGAGRGLAVTTAYVTDAELPAGAMLPASDAAGSAALLLASEALARRS